MKFKVGDRVRVREDLQDGETYGTHYFVEEMEKYRGKCFEITFIHYACCCYELKGCEDYYFTDEMLEYADFGFNDLKAGDRLTFEDGNNDIILRNVSTNCLSVETLDSFLYEEEFKKEVKCVERPKEYKTVYEKQEPKIVKMTVSEIAKKLGHKVEIVEEEY